MCGIFYTNKTLSDKILADMFKSLELRGPDAKGIYKDKKGFVIGHTRLAIIDIDPRSNQPMQTNNYVVSFNGEIYNYKKIKSILSDYKFKTNSDTETIIALYDKFGIDGWKYLEGMFAFIFYDKKQNKTYFLRDPVGIKPLYYYYNSGDLIIGSKVSTILNAVGELPIDYRAVNDILALGYPRKPIYQRIAEFEPGYVYDTNLKSTKIDFIINKEKTIKDAIIEQFENTDRPIGITLSGGIDSGYIAYVCSKISKSKIHTFTIGFSDKDDDVINARKLAKFIGSEHHEIIVPNSVYDQNLKEGLKKLEAPYDLGSVAVTNLLGKEIAKTDIKVILVGDGSDEIQGGYKRYAEKSGLRTAELWEWYIKRIIKNDFDDRKKILKDDAYNVTISSDYNQENANKILWCDYKNELRYYHIKRMDHIISDFGIEARFPYLDHSFIMNTFDQSFSKKVNTRGNKLLLRDFAEKDGLPHEFAFRPKVPFKRKDFDAKKHLEKLWRDFNG